MLCFKSRKAIAWLKLLASISYRNKDSFNVLGSSALCGFYLGNYNDLFLPTHTPPKSNNCLGVKFVCATSLRVSVGVPLQHSLSIWNVLGWWLKCYLYSYDDANFQVCAFMIVAFSSSTFCVQEGGGCLGYVHIYTYQFWRLAGLTDPQHWQHDFKM